MYIAAGKFFEGPFQDISSLKRESGVYIILGGRNNNQWEPIIDVGESEDVYSRVKNHDRQLCWISQGYSHLLYCAYYTTSQIDRTIIEQQIREKENPPCGER